MAGNRFLSGHEYLPASDGKWVRHRANDETLQHKYFTMIPNMIDDSNLSPHAIRLYLHIKRVAGEDGTCWQSTTTLTKKCHMGARTVRKTEKDLVAAGLIHIEQPRIQRLKNHKVNLISIVDIWSKNESQYSAKADKVKMIAEPCASAV